MFLGIDLPPLLLPFGMILGPFGTVVKLGLTRRKGHASCRVVTPPVWVPGL